MHRKVVATHLGLVIALLLTTSGPFGIRLATTEWDRLSNRLLILEGYLATEVSVRQASMLEPVMARFARRAGGGAMVTDSSGWVVAAAGLRPTPAAMAELARRSRGGEPILEKGKFLPDSAELVVVADRVEAGPLRGGTVFVCAGTDRVRAHLRFQWLLIAVMVMAGLAVAAGSATLILHWTQAPIRMLESIVGVPDRTGHVVPLTAAHTGPREVRRLADSMNRAAATSKLVTESDQLLLADIAHQLRSQLQLLGFRLERLAMYTRPEGMTMHDQVMANMERLRSSMDELIDVRQESPPVNVAVRSVVSERTAAWSDIAESRGLTLQASAVAPSVILAQRGILDQVLDILLDNAIKFSPPQGQITVSALSGDFDVTVQVVDQGRGMTAEERTHATARGWRGNESKRVDGRGLGLCIANMLVITNGGRLTLHAGPCGKGLDVRIRFPRVE